MTGIISDFHPHREPADSGTQSPPDVRVISFADLFAAAPLPLDIDAYQRPYVWGTDKSKQLLADLKEHNKKAAAGLDYYMGTILLHRCGKEDRLFVIDGQQRLTTLCLLHRALHPALPPNCQLSYRNPDSWRNIKRTAGLFAAAANKLPHAGIFDRISFTVITVDSEDLAFTFFDTQNNRGVPLAATDLLKAYHPRAIEGQDSSSLALQKSCAARWESIQNLPPLLGPGSDFAPSLFQCFLWRGRRWTGRHLEPRASHDDLIHEFQDRSIRSPFRDTVPLYSSRGNRRAAAITLVPRDGYRLRGEDIPLSSDPAELPFAIRQPLSAGVGFFLYCEKYAALSRQLLNPDHEDAEVRAFQRFHQAVIEPVSIYLRELFLLACVQFVDQFGYRQLLRFALWLDHALGAIRIEKAYIFEAAPLNFLRNGSQNLLDVIAGAFRPEEVIDYLKALPEPARTYATRDVSGNGVQGRYKQSVLGYLRQLDNLLLASNDDRPLVERSNDFLRDPDHKPQLLDIAVVLARPDGVRFPHYWFYKLEFVLWHGNHLGLSPAEQGAFRMTAKNSIEHISPQTAQGVDFDTVSPEVLDTFGNLALVSRGLNSEYGNKPYTEKQAHFVNHNRDRIDSLKMKALYRSSTWGDTEAREHQKEMIGLLQSYLATAPESLNPSATH